MVDEQGKFRGKFDPKKYWRRHLMECPYSKGYRCLRGKIDGCEGCETKEKNDEKTGNTICTG